VIPLPTVVTVLDQFGDRPILRRGGLIDLPPFSGDTPAASLTGERHD